MQVAMSAWGLFAALVLAMLAIDLAFDARERHLAEGAGRSISRVGSRSGWLSWFSPSLSSPRWQWRVHCRVAPLANCATHADVYNKSSIRRVCQPWWAFAEPANAKLSALGCVAHHYPRRDRGDCRLPCRREKAVAQPVGARHWSDHLRQRGHVGAIHRHASERHVAHAWFDASDHGGLGVSVW